MVQMLMQVAGRRVMVMESSASGGERRGDVQAVAKYACCEGAGLVVRDEGMSESALQRMIKGRRAGVAKVLLEAGGVRMEWRNAGGWTALHDAAWLGDVHMLRLLLQYGAEVDAPDLIGRSPLHFAVRYGCDAVVVLLDAGADVNHGDIYGRTPLHIAARRSEEDDVIRLLLRCGGDSHLLTVRGKTALHFAAATASKEVAALLLGVH
jgi:cytohesin